MQGRTKGAVKMMATIHANPRRIWPFVSCHDPGMIRFMIGGMEFCPMPEPWFPPGGWSNEKAGTVSTPLPHPASHPECNKP